MVEEGGSGGDEGGGNWDRCCGRGSARSRALEGEASGGGRDCRGDTADDWVRTSEDGGETGEGHGKATKSDGRSALDSRLGLGVSGTDEDVCGLFLGGAKLLSTTTGKADGGRGEGVCVGGLRGTGGPGRGDSAGTRGLGVRWGRGDGGGHGRGGAAPALLDKGLLLLLDGDHGLDLFDGQGVVWGDGEAHDDGGDGRGAGVVVGDGDVGVEGRDGDGGAGRAADGDAAAFAGGRGGGGRVVGVLLVLGGGDAAERLGKRRERLVGRHAEQANL